MEGVWVGLVMRVTAADTKIILEIPCTKQKTTIIIIIIITILYQAHCSYFGWGGRGRGGEGMLRLMLFLCSPIKEKKKSK